MKTNRLTDRIDVRLPADMRAALERDAAARCMLVVDLVRERLELAQMVADSINSLRDEVAFRLGSNEPQRAGAGSGPGPDGVLIEMLLLLRSIAGPQKQNAAAGEVERNGLDVWIAKGLR